jgi:integrase
MARTIQLKTAKEIEHLVKQEGTHPVEPGLYLQVHRAAVSWLHRYRFKGKSRWSGLGSYPAVNLGAARAKLKDEQTKIRAGVDPVEERKQQRVEKVAERPKPKKTFREVAKDYIINHESSWTNPKHRNAWTVTLETYAYPVIGDMAVDEITTENVREVLQPIWYTKAVTARRVRGRIEKVLSFAKPLGLRAGENPARWADNIEHIFPKREKKRKVKNHPAMPYGELPAFMVRLREQGGLSAKALEFTILTAVRTGDVIGGDREERPPMVWSHVDLDGKVWTIPATKNDSSHTVPLSDPAVAVLKSVKALGIDPELVFPSPGKGQPLSNNGMRGVLARMGHGDITVHGFRSSFRDWAAECTNFPRELAEKALAHTIGDETERAYQRGDLLIKRAKLMAAWAGYCDRPAAAGKVLSMRR